MADPRAQASRSGLIRTGQGGFTLVELVIVIVLVAVVGATVAIVVKPAVDAYWRTKVRSELVDVADSALRRLLRDVRAAVPNSIRTPPGSTQCIELVPTRSGGRYRTAADTVRDGATCPAGANCSAPLQTGAANTRFDSLSAVDAQVGDFVVVYSTTPDDVYGGSRRAVIGSLGAPPLASHGVTRIGLNNPGLSLPAGTPLTGRYVVVAQAEQSVFYVCDAVSAVNGEGTGRLYRLVRNFTAAAPGACPAVSPANAAIVADRLSACEFDYGIAGNQRAFLKVRLGLQRAGEAVQLVSGAHVANEP